MRLGRPADARRTFETLAAKNPIGYLVEAPRSARRSAPKRSATAPAPWAYARLASTETTYPTIS